MLYSLNTDGQSSVGVVSLSFTLRSNRKINKNVVMWCLYCPKAGSVWPTRPPVTTVTDHFCTRLYSPSVLCRCRHYRWLVYITEAVRGTAKERRGHSFYSPLVRVKMSAGSSVIRYRMPERTTEHRSAIRSNPSVCMLHAALYYR